VLDVNLTGAFRLTRDALGPMMRQRFGRVSHPSGQRQDRDGGHEEDREVTIGREMLERELKRGSTELLVLALLEERDRHGYEIARLIEGRSGGAISFHVASLYPTLYRMEDRGLIQGRWIEKTGQRRRRYYHITAAGRTVLASQRSTWQAFIEALSRVARIRHA
jgi:transcriptional regulator